ncbi:MAG: VWA domain-containing protein [Alphaproteobacteria bacterium]
MLENLHFIRPQWLWLLLVNILPLLLWLKSKQGFSPWRRICHNHLLKYILGEGSNISFAPFFLFFITWSLAVFAGSSPSTEKYPMPTYRVTTPIVILLDASLDMNVKDLAPSRFDRAKFKIMDFIKTIQGEKVALTVFSDYPYTIVPFSDDKTVLENALKTLSLSIMPSYGHNLTKALVEAENMLKAINEKGNIIIFTASAGSNISETIDEARKIASQKHQISIVGVGTSKGDILYNQSGGFAKDNQGKPLFSKLDSRGLDIIATAGGGTYSEISLNDSDLKKIYTPKNIDSFNISYKKTEIKADEWQDLGAKFLIIVLILASFAFRKGWLGCIALFIIMTPIEAKAFSLSDWFLNDNQKAKIMLEDNNFEEAAKLFKDKNWQAVSKYRAGDYKGAQEIWQKQKDETNLYNQGNASALAGDYQKAIDYYNQVLALNKNHKDAEFNKNLVEKLLQKQQSSSDNQNKDDNKQNQPQNNQSADNKQQQNQNNNQQQQENQDKKQEQNQKQLEKNNQSQKNENQPQNASEQSKQQPSPQQEEAQKKQEQQEARKALAEQKINKDKNQEEPQNSSENTPIPKKLNEKEQAAKQLMDRIEDDPGELLKNILSLRYQALESKRK